MRPPRPVTVPFPPSPEGERLALRGFGTEGDDLTVDFTAAPPYLITDLLRRCCRPNWGAVPGEEFFWELSVAVRIEALLALAALRSPAPLWLTFSCEAPACRQPMEVDLDLDEVRQYAAGLPQAETLAVGLDDRVVTLRRPRG